MIILLFALLIVFTSRWTVFQASSLNNNTLNVRTLIDELKIKRGRILAADGTVLAKSVPAAGDTWSRTYPQGSLFAQPVGILDRRPRASAAGLERPPARICAASRPGSARSSVSSARGRSATTCTRRSTQGPASRPQQALAGQAGSVVALDPQHGRGLGDVLESGI